MQFVVVLIFVALLAASGVFFYRKSFTFGYVFLGMAFAPIAANALFGALGIPLLWW
jgi:hypothetical protein